MKTSKRLGRTLLREGRQNSGDGKRKWGMEQEKLSGLGDGKAQKRRSVGKDN